MRTTPLLAVLAIAAAVVATPAHAQAGHAGHAGHSGHPPAAKAADSSAKAGAHAAHAAQASARSGMAEHTSGWKELDAYHMVMMQVWHPAKEKGDLAPVRAHAPALAALADSVAASTIPAACDTPANREGVTTLRADSRALVAAAAGTTADADLLAALRAVHDRFEGVNRSCKAK